MSTIIITGADLAPQALELLAGHEIVYAGKTPTEESLDALCREPDPVAPTPARWRDASAA